MNNNAEIKQEKQRRFYGILGAVFFHALVFLALFFMAFRTPLPLPGEEGMEVNLGFSDQGMGDIQPEQPSMLRNSQPAQSSPRSDDEVVTENNPDEVALDKVKSKKQTQNNQNVTQPSDQQANNVQPVVNPNALYKGKSNKSTTGGSQGNTGQPGDQGKSTGTPDGKGYDGNGGKGNSIGYDLAGRSSISLARPVYNSDDQGKIVVKVWVNQQGIVTKVLSGVKGTTISDLSLRKQCEEAAKRSKFSVKADAPEEQTGTITYTFIKGL